MKTDLQLAQTLHDLIPRIHPRHVHGQVALIPRTIEEEDFADAGRYLLCLRQGVLDHHLDAELFAYVRFETHLFRQAIILIRQIDRYKVI